VLNTRTILGSCEREEQGSAWCGSIAQLWTS
jgi:hypothetical protein